jgi:hypothetical protein
MQGFVLFGNNRFLAGFDSQGFLVLDAVTGAVLARERTISQGSLFLDGSDSASNSPGAAQFHCLSFAERSSAVHRLEINLSGRLTAISRRAVPSTVANITCGISGDGENIILGTGEGGLWLMGRTNVRIMDTGNPELITDMAVSSSIAFVTEKNSLGCIPLDYSLFEQNRALTLESIASAGTEILSNISSADMAYRAYNETEGTGFLLWQPGANHSTPVLRTLSPFLTGGSARLALENLQSRFPLRSASVKGNSILFLDTSGLVSVLDRRNGALRFTYSAVGAVERL